MTASPPSSLAARFRPAWPHAFIAGFVALQLLVPLHYYALRRDDHDERFAWRMFSSTRMLACTVELRVDDRPVELAAEFHDAWIAIARRGRRAVIEAMGARLCQRHPGSAVTAFLTCTPVRGAAYSVGGFDLCTIPEL